MLSVTDNLSADLWQHSLLDVKSAERLHSFHDVPCLDDDDVTRLSITRSAHRRWLLARGQCQ